MSRAKYAKYAKLVAGLGGMSRAKYAKLLWNEDTNKWLKSRRDGVRPSPKLESLGMRACNLHKNMR